MKNLDGNYYVEVKDKRNLIHPKVNLLLGLCDERSLTTQHKNQDNTQLRKIRKLLELILMN